MGYCGLFQNQGGLSQDKKKYCVWYKILWTFEHASMLTLTHQTLPGYTRAKNSSLKLSQLKTPETKPPYVVYHS